MMTPSDPPDAGPEDVGDDAGVSSGDTGSVGGASGATEAGDAGGTEDSSPAGSSPSSSGPTEVQRQLQQDSFSPAADQRGPGASRTEAPAQTDTHQEDARRDDVRSSQQRSDAVKTAAQRDTFEAAPKATPASLSPINRPPTPQPATSPTSVPPRPPTTPTGMSPGRPDIFVADRLTNQPRAQALAAQQFPTSRPNTYNVGDKYTNDPNMTGDAWDPNAGMSGGNRIWADTAGRRTNEGMARIGTTDRNPAPSITAREMERFDAAGAPITTLDPKAKPDTSWPDRTPTQTKPELHPDAPPRPTPPAAAPREPTQTKPELSRSAQPRPEEDAAAARRAEDQRVQAPAARAATVRPQTPGGPKVPGPAGGATPQEIRSPTPRTGAFHSGFAGVDRGTVSATAQRPEAYSGRGAAVTQETRVRNGESVTTLQDSHGTRRNGQRDSAPTVQRSDAPEGHIRTSGAVRTQLLNPADANATLAGAPRTNVPLLNDPASGVTAEAHYQGPAINLSGNAYANWTGSGGRPGMDLHVDAKIDANVVSGGGSVTRDFHFNNGGHDYTVRVRMATDGQVGLNGTLRLDVHAGLDRAPSFTVGAEGFGGAQAKLTGGIQVFMDNDQKNPMMQGDLSVMLGAGVGGAYELSATPNTFHTKAYAYAGVGVGVDLNATVDWVKMSNTALPRGTVMPFDPNARWWGPLHQLQWWQGN